MSAQTRRLPSTPATDSCADKLRVLADTSRLAIVRTLLTGPQRVGEINEQLQLEPSLLSHHLRILREAGLVECERDGKAVVYRLAPTVKLRAARPGLQLGCCVISFA